MCVFFSPSSFLLFFSQGSQPTLSTTIVWDDVDVLSKASLVSAFCRDRRGLRDPEKKEFLSRR